MTNVNSFDDFIKSTAYVTYAIHTLHIWTSTNRIFDRLNQLRMEFQIIFQNCFSLGGQHVIIDIVYTIDFMINTTRLYV